MKNNTTKLALRAHSIRNLTAAELRVAYGGLNPQPLPPGHEIPAWTVGPRFRKA